MARRDEGRKDQDGVFQHQRRGMEHTGEYRRKNRDGRQYSSHTGKIEERMRRGAVMVRAGEGMSVVKRCGVDLARQPCPDGDADEQQGQRRTHFVDDN